MGVGGASPRPDAPDLYLDLLMRVLTRYLLIDEEVWDVGQSPQGWAHKRDTRSRIKQLVRGALARRGLRLVRTGGSPQLREVGEDWPPTAETMVGLRRLENVRDCIDLVVQEEIPGDLIETGVWRGGCAIFIRAALAAHQVEDRAVWVADSFQGLAAPDPVAHPKEFGVDLSTFDELAVGLEQVKSNFRRYGLLDEQVRFLPGWFADTLPAAPIKRLALIRLDGDYYESTMTALRNLYPKLSSGGFVIVDDYQIEACREAVADYMAEVGERFAIEMVDASSAFWRRG